MHLTFAFSCRFWRLKKQRQEHRNFFLSFFILLPSSPKCIHIYIGTLLLSLSLSQVWSIQCPGCIQIEFVPSFSVLFSPTFSFFLSFFILDVFLVFPHFTTPSHTHSSSLTHSLIANTYTDGNICDWRSFSPIRCSRPDSLRVVWAVTVAGQNRIELKQKCRLPFCMNKNFFLV